MISRNRSLFPVRAFSQARCRSVFAVISREGLSTGLRSVRTYAQIPVKEAANIRELSLATRIRHRRALGRPLDAAPKTTNESKMCEPLECTFAGTPNLHWIAPRKGTEFQSIDVLRSVFPWRSNTRRQCHRSSLPLCVWRQTTPFCVRGEGVQGGPHSLLAAGLSLRSCSGAQGTTRRKGEASQGECMDGMKMIVNALKNLSHECM